MIVRKTRPEEYRRVNELFAICFEEPYENCPIDPEDDHNHHWAAYTDDGEMMSTFTVFGHSIHFDGHICRMGGIGGVVTLPEFRRRGGIRGCFEAALPDLYAKGYDFSYLYPFSTAFYRKFGYESCVQKYQWIVNLPLLELPGPEGCFRLVQRHRPMTEEIRLLERRWEQHFNMMVRHEDDAWQWTREADPAVSREYTYVSFDAAGLPNGCATFTMEDGPEGENPVCSRFVFTDKAGFTGLMQVFRSMSADHVCVRFQTPAIPAVQYLVSEWGRDTVRWELLHNCGMVRVINVCRVLEQARYLGSGQAVLEIRDPQIPENNRRFHVTFADGAAVSVEATAQPADIVLSIAAFSALIVGVCDFHEAGYTLSGLELRRDNPHLSQIFYRKPLLINDGF